MKDFEVRKKILVILKDKDKEFVSGEAISRKLGFSRAYLWKQIKRLRQEGYEIKAVPRRGYSLVSLPDKIYGYELADINAEVLGKRNIYYYESIGSTNDIAYKLAEDGAMEGSVVISESQVSGRGRMRRKWDSPHGGIYLSIILRPEMDIEELPCITLVSALAVVRAVKRICPLDVKIKWPNDVLIGGRKVCGILTEVKAQPGMVDFLILGIGINVNIKKQDIPAEATSLKIEAEEHIDRKRLLGYMLEEIEKIYQCLIKEGFSSIRQECKENLMMLNKRVTINDYNRAVEGVALDIDEKGLLILQTDDGKCRRIFSGDVKQ
ncbi:MAG: biotin--[acetyl-CoA-carboxylase] ligase [Candidatus Omnitrophota bacterium]